MNNKFLLITALMFATPYSIIHTMEKKETLADHNDTPKSKTPESIYSLYQQAIDAAEIDSDEEEFDPTALSSGDSSLPKDFTPEKLETIQNIQRLEFHNRLAEIHMQYLKSKEQPHNVKKEILEEILLLQQIIRGMK